MNDTMIFRPKLALDREVGQHRTWWVFSDAMTGNALKVLLALIAHDHAEQINQTDLQISLGLGESAWRSAKDNLKRAGFLLEVRDRYPSSARRADGSPCGGQKRFRLLLQDPPEGTHVDLADAIIESTDSILLPGETPGQGQSRKSRVGTSTTLDNHEWAQKAQVRTSRDNHESELSSVDNSPATLDFQESLIGTQERIGLDGLDMDFDPVHSTPQRESRASSQPVVAPVEISEPRQSAPTPGAINSATALVQAQPTLAALDAELASIHPTLSVAAFREELGGRVNLAEIDLVLASREVLSRAKREVSYAPSYVAVSIVKSPARFRLGRAPFAPQQPAAELSESDVLSQRKRKERAACERGDHDWGPPSWPVLDRGHCVREACGMNRASVDPDFAVMLDLAEKGGGSEWGV